MTDPKTERLDRLAIDTIRTLAIDGVPRADSGHPGARMGLAKVRAIVAEESRAGPATPPPAGTEGTFR